MVVHQKTSTYYYTRNRMEIGTTYRLRTPKTGLGEGGGRGKRNLKANSFKRKSVDGYIIKLSEEEYQGNSKRIIQM